MIIDNFTRGGHQAGGGRFHQRLQYRLGDDQCQPTYPPPTA